MAAGNVALMRELGLVGRVRLWPSVGGRAEASGHSVIYVGWGERVRAVISLDDAPLPEARVDDRGTAQPRPAHESC